MEYKKINNKHLLFNENAVDLLDFMIKENKTIHDTEKPVELTDVLISNSSKEGDIIFDPFMEIAGCGVSSAKLGRDFIGCELEKKYFDFACERVGGVRC